MLLSEHFHSSRRQVASARDHAAAAAVIASVKDKHVPTFIMYFRGRGMQLIEARALFASVTLTLT